jgi:ectoine hydroxylase-related dioxygenase (phytanoyl-CoA dioxygenase family)
MDWDQLRDDGFIVVPGPAIGAHARLAEAYDRAVTTAEPENTSSKTSNLRVSDFVNRGLEFDAVYVHPPLLDACSQVIGRPFKLSSMHARTVQPGAPAQGLHQDVRPHADGWPLVGFILMIDEFYSENGATRFVPGSQHLRNEPSDEHVLACGPAGSMIVFNGSCWHGFSANRTAGGRRSIQGAFIPRDATPGTVWSTRMRPETLTRISDLAKYVLNV